MSTIRHYNTLLTQHNIRKTEIRTDPNMKMKLYISDLVFSTNKLSPNIIQKELDEWYLLMELKGMYNCMVIEQHECSIKCFEGRNQEDDLLFSKILNNDKHNNHIPNKPIVTGSSSFYGNNNNNKQGFQNNMSGFVFSDSSLNLKGSNKNYNVSKNLRSCINLWDSKYEPIIRTLLLHSYINNAECEKGYVFKLSKHHHLYGCFYSGRVHLCHPVPEHRYSTCKKTLVVDSFRGECICSFSGLVVTVPEIEEIYEEYSVSYDFKEKNNEYHSDKGGETIKDMCYLTKTTNIKTTKSQNVTLKMSRKKIQTDVRSLDDRYSNYQLDNNTIGHYSDVKNIKTYEYMTNTKKRTQDRLNADTFNYENTRINSIHEIDHLYDTRGKRPYKKKKIGVVTDHDFFSSTSSHIKKSVLNNQNRVSKTDTNEKDITDDMSDVDDTDDDINNYKDKDFNDTRNEKGTHNDAKQTEDREKLLESPSCKRNIFGSVKDTENSMNKKVTSDSSKISIEEELDRAKFILDMDKQASHINKSVSIGRKTEDPNVLDFHDKNRTNGSNNKDILRIETSNTDNVSKNNELLAFDVKTDINSSLTIRTTLSKQHKNGDVQSTAKSHVHIKSHQPNKTISARHKDIEEKSQQFRNIGYHISFKYSEIHWNEKIKSKADILISSLIRTCVLVYWRDTVIIHNNPKAFSLEKYTSTSNSYWTTLKRIIPKLQNMHQSFYCSDTTLPHSNSMISNAAKQKHNLHYNDKNKAKINGVINKNNTMHIVHENRNYISKNKPTTKKCMLVSLILGLSDILTNGLVVSNISVIDPFPNTAHVFPENKNDLKITLSDLKELFSKKINTLYHISLDEFIKQKGDTSSSLQSNQQEYEYRRAYVEILNYVKESHQLFCQIVKNKSGQFDYKKNCSTGCKTIREICRKCDMTPNEMRNMFYGKKTEF